MNPLNYYKYIVYYDPLSVEFQNSNFESDGIKFLFTSDNVKGILNATLEDAASNSDRESFLKSKLKEILNNIIYLKGVSLEEPILIEVQLNKENKSYGESNIEASISCKKAVTIDEKTIEKALKVSSGVVTSIDVTLYASAIKLNNKVAAFELLYAILYRIFSSQDNIDKWLCEKCYVSKDCVWIDDRSGKKKMVTIYTKLRNEIHHMKKRDDQSTSIKNPDIEKTLDNMIAAYESLKLHVRKAISS